MTTKNELIMVLFYRIFEISYSGKKTNVPANIISKLHFTIHKLWVFGEIPISEWYDILKNKNIFASNSFAIFCQT